MIGLGHNGGPAFDGFDLHITDLFATVSNTVAGAVVENDEQDAALEGLKVELRQASKDADAARAAEKRPHDDAAKAVQVKWLPLIKRCDAALSAIKALQTPYRAAKRAREEAEADRLREEAVERERAAREAYQAAPDLETQFAAETEKKAAKKLTAVANKIDRAPTGLRTGYRHEITDMTAFARWAWANRRSEVEAFFEGLAKRETQHGPVTIPGLIVHIERKAA